ncbi:endonuclease III [Acidobacteria bacterium AH-259-A15]|nr:endonuclease III [Acidobacteria bacterium AH-259-A15]
MAEILRRLDNEYPEATCALHYENPYQLLVATVLSAQCTDERVNMVTPQVFRRYPNPGALAQADENELQELIRSTGFFRNKAKNLIGAAKKRVEEFDGEVPRRMEDLIELDGVARKTANVVLGTAFTISSGVVVDTHVKRLSRRLGLSAQNDPNKIEKDLMRQIPEHRWIDFGHQLIHHGRRICKARKPICPECVLSNLCLYYQELSK